MIIQDVRISNNYGIHLRPASELIESVKCGNSRVSLIYNGNTAPVISVISILKLGIKKGSLVTLVVEGPDEEVIFERLRSCITNN